MFLVIFNLLLFTYEIISVKYTYIHNQKEDDITFKIRPSFQQFVEKCVFNSK